MIVYIILFVYVFVYCSLYIFYIYCFIDLTLKRIRRDNNDPAPEEEIVPSFSVTTNTHRSLINQAIYIIYIYKLQHTNIYTNYIILTNTTTTTTT